MMGWIIFIANTLAWTVILTTYALFAWEMSDEPDVIVFGDPEKLEDDQ